MQPPKMRELTVTRSEQITPNMQRVWLQSADLNDFPEDSAGDYFKLLFNADGTAISSAAQLETLEGRPVLRTYTVRDFVVASKTLVVDFVRHESDGHSGPASTWACNAKAGDSIVMRGPATGKTINTHADYLIFAADMTAMPAMSAQLETLPSDAKGTAIIEVISEDDAVPLDAPEGIDVQWVVNETPAQANTVLSDAVKALDWPEGNVAAWAACEFSNMRLLREYFKKDRALPRENLYISSYWKIDNTEEQHKVAKRTDAETEGA